MSSLSKIADPIDAFGARGAADAADAQRQASQQSIGELTRQFDIQQENLRPFRELTLPALEKISAFTGASGVESQQRAFADFAESPGQLFLRNRAEKSLLRNQAAIGGLGGGNVRKALQEQAVGLAQQDFSNQFNRLASLAGVAQQTTAQQGALGERFAGSVGSELTNQANAFASGQAAQQQAKSNLIGTAAGVAGAVFSDRRLKQNIEQIGVLDNGLAWYKWEWKDFAMPLVGNQESEGVMADEAIEVNPNAVWIEDGYMKVDYGVIL